jgi:hypothetical protein
MAAPQGLRRMEGAELRRKGILALALIATLTIGVSVAFAAKSYRTHIVFLGNSGPPPNDLSDQTFYGDLQTKHKCRGAREMGLFRKTANGYKLIDVDLSSFNGAWALRADVTGAPDLAVKVKRDRRKHGRVVCKPDKITLSQSPPA